MTVTPISRRVLPWKLSRASIARDGAWVAAGQLGSALAALFSIRMMTELLSPEQFGRLTLLVGIAGLALGLAATPRIQAMMRYYPAWSTAGRVDVLRSVSARYIATFVIIAGALISMSWIFATQFLGGDWFTGFLITALLIVDCCRSFELGLLNAARRQRGAASIYALDAWSRPLAAIIAVAVFGSNADAALAGYVSGSAFVLLVMRFSIRLEGREAALLITPEAESGSQAHLLTALRRYAWPLAPLALFGWISGMGDRYVLGSMLGLEQAGLYAAAYGLASRPFLMLSGIIELTMRPVLQNAITAGNRKLSSKVQVAFVSLVGIGAILGVAAFIVLNNIVADWLLAAEYRSAAYLMPWIAFGYALYVTSNVFSRFCYSFDDTVAVLILTVAGAIVGVAVLVPAIKFGDLWGAAVAVPLRFLVELTLSFILARRAERRFFCRQPKEALVRG